MKFEFLKFIIDIAVNVFISSFLTVLLSQLFHKREEYRRELLEAYRFFELLETKMDRFSPEEINERIVNYRLLFSKDKKLRDCFHKVDISLTVVNQANITNGHATFNFHDDAYFEFLQTLKEELRIKEK